MIPTVTAVIRIENYRHQHHHPERSINLTLLTCCCRLGLIEPVHFMAGTGKYEKQDQQGKAAFNGNFILLYAPPPPPAHSITIK
jgi:hypothetical protein